MVTIRKWIKILKIMSRIIVVVFILMWASSPVFSQEINYLPIKQQTDYWSQELIENKLLLGLSNLNAYQRESYTSLVNSALERDYKMIPIFHATLSEIENNTATIQFELEQNEFPLDVYFINKKQKVKLLVNTYKGQMEGSVDTRFRTMLSGLAKKMRKAFHHVLKLRPDLIFDLIEFEEMFGCFFYVKNDVVFVYDYYHNESSSLQEYTRLNNLLSCIILTVS